MIIQSLNTIIHGGFRKYDDIYRMHGRDCILVNSTHYNGSHDKYYMSSIKYGQSVGLAKTIVENIIF